jgi:predicted metalloprotease
MPFNDNAQLDPSQIQDRRGSGGGGFGGRGRRIAFGGGGCGLLVLIIIAIMFGFNPLQLLGMVDTGEATVAPSTGDISGLAADCQTGADANARQECAVVGYVNSIQAYWSDEFAAQGIQYTEAQTVLYSDYTDAACGYAQSAMGPFYCPTDQTVYLDMSFFSDLQTQYGAQGGPFAEAYILAHEYGHHVQDLLGILDSSSNSSDDSILIELQADCLAGVWMNHAVETGYLEQVTSEEIAQALNAAAAVGDDRIQKETRGYITPETWTHGSSEQRQAALEDGYYSGDIDSCETPGWQ